MERWQRTSELDLGLIKKGLNSLIILGAWILWNHQNRCVFYGIAPNTVTATAQAEDEGERGSWLEQKGFHL
jgi:hypothetical protein